MAGKTREIKGRIKAVSNIQRITKTMQMIATARFQAMQRRATEAQAYTQKIAELVEELSGALAAQGQIRHPLLNAPDPAVGKRLLLVITSNRGLCGAYNANVLRTAMRFLRDEHPDEQIDVEAVGKKAVSYFKFNRVPVERIHTQFGDKPPYEEVDRLAERFMQAFTAGQYDGVHVAYTHFKSMSKQEPIVTQLLPMENPTTDTDEPVGPTADYEFSPDPEQILAELLPVTVKTRLFQCFNEAVVSEQLARMVAMKGATDAAGRMKRDLNRKYNRARQAAITTELTEIIGGAAALE
ncbi:MAG: ATP synthase F1 subunit gamma [Hyphomicrobiales bacterium]